MKTPEQIADAAYEQVARKYDVEREGEHETWEVALYWTLGEGVGYETVREVVLAAIEADRAQRDDADEQPTFTVGDQVRLTGLSWGEFNMRGDVVTITGYEEFTGDAEFESEDGTMFVIWSKDDEDYSAVRA